MSAREVYESSVRTLPVIERLRLASLILDDLTASGAKEPDIRDDWSDDDVADLAAFSLGRASRSPLAKDADA